MSFSHCNKLPAREHVVNVEWNDAPLAAFVHKYHGRKLVVEYTVEIFPSATEGSLKNQGLCCEGGLES